MKKIISIIFIYTALIGSVFSFYYAGINKYSEKLHITEMQIEGVAYLKKLSLLTKEATEFTSNRYSGSVNTKKQNEISRLIDNIKRKRKSLYGLQNELLDTQLSKIKSFNYSDNDYYEFLNLLIAESYAVGNKSELLFEHDHKLYFLNTLITQHLSKCLMNVSIINNVLREKSTGVVISYDRENLYIKHNQLAELSFREINSVVNFIKKHEDTEILHTLISKTLKIFSKKLFSFEEKLIVSNEIYDLSNQLHTHTFKITKLNYINRKIDLEEKILFIQLMFYFTLFIITILAIYVWFVLRESKHKEYEIIKLNDSLEKLVLFSTADKQGIITHVSKAMLESSGFKKEDVIGKTHAIFKHPDTPKEFYKNLWETILDKETWVGDIKNVKKDGSVWWAKTIIVPELDKYDEITSFISYRFDISYQKELEVEKARTQEALSFKSKFLSKMSHEIRTPLNGILGITNATLKTDLDENQSNMLLEMKSISDMLLDVMNDILDISKIESGKMTIEHEPINLKDIVEDVQYIVLSKAKEKGLEVHIDYINMEKFTFKGDSLRISQVLTNLMVNAIKFTSEGSVTLHVTQKSDNTLLFEVIDTGVGIKHTVLGTLFDEFTQIDVPTSTKYGGTGLGLSISKNLIELMGGKIWVDSVFGEGSTFSFVLELEKCVDFIDAHKVTQEDKNLIETKVNSLENISILVAEDNKMNQMVLSMLLEASKIDIEFADDGLDALTKFKENQYELIFMDIQMPVMNGYDATVKIRELDKNIPIVALSANAIQEDIDQALESGMNDYLLKPIDVDKLYATLLKYIKH